ncbi:prevent-host-death family protein [Saccharomonospora amisosensis]|uniref:Antitoxin n=1 Tax=Saccharomonospora amisosensis TaxID=1128677 RepID=A0A7X5UQM0_9PSEU|nr:type II toxin-antitoxin system prevent-host-death family antitoxin [Saccharomonospora amisosensis]NIJ11924.1 prevent-host-death family protein [Saccharomonospora amisosensis]
MPEITPSELRNDSSRILSRVERGERFTVVRGNTPTAEVIPVQRRQYQTRAEIAEAVANLPAVDAARLRADIDAVVDSDVTFDE